MANGKPPWKHGGSDDVICFKVAIGRAGREGQGGESKGFSPIVANGGVSKEARGENRGHYKESGDRR